MRNFSIDRWEPFERSILTSYNSAIAIQAVEMYTNMEFRDLEKIKGLEEFPASADDLINQLDTLELLKKPVENETAKELIYAWIKLQVDFLNVLDDHNENFWRMKLLLYR